MLVYILSDYGEDGAQNVTATLRPELLAGMIETWFAECDQAMLAWQDEAKQSIAVLLEKEPSQLINPNGHYLHHGWGGAMLHVVELVIQTT